MLNDLTGLRPSELGFPMPSNRSFWTLSRGSSDGFIPYVTGYGVWSVNDTIRFELGGSIQSILEYVRPDTVLDCIETFDYSVSLQVRLLTIYHCSAICTIR